MPLLGFSILVRAIVFDLFFNTAKEMSLEGSTEKDSYFDSEGFKWIKADDPEIEHRSAVAVAFAHRLRQLVKDDIPIGIVQCTIGGTNIQSWMPASEVPEKYVDTKNFNSGGLCLREVLSSDGGAKFLRLCSGIKVSQMSNAPLSIRAFLPL